MCFVSAKTVSNDITEKQIDETCVVSEVKKNPGLWQKVKDVFKKIVDDIYRICCTGTAEWTSRKCRSVRLVWRKR